MSVKVRKYTGEMETFSPEKLRRSMLRAGANEGAADAVVKSVSARLHDGITTREIYKMAKRELRKVNHLYAARYDLKEALMRLGPQGYAFEKYVAHLLRHEGYAVELNQMIHGRCVEHEVDVCASKGDDRILVECKHHERVFHMCRIQTALYVKARFDDLAERFNRVMLVTNTKFSKQAIDYARCAGVELLGWRYPEHSLETMIDSKRLWPVTVLTSIGKSEVQACIDADLLLVVDLQRLDATTIQKRLKTSSKRAERIAREAVKVLGAEKQ